MSDIFQYGLEAGPHSLGAAFASKPLCAKFWAWVLVNAELVHTILLMAQIYQANLS